MLSSPHTMKAGRRLAQHGCIFGGVLINLHIHGAFVVFLESTLLTVHGAIEVTLEVLVRYTIQFVLHTALLLALLYQMNRDCGVPRGVPESTVCRVPSRIYKHMECK